MNLPFFKREREKSGIKVGDIMTRNFVAVHPDTNLIDCAKEMIKKRVGSLILKEGQRLVGLLTEKDIIWALIKKSKTDLRWIKARDIASKKVATIKPSADVYEALQRMKKLKFRRFPVMVNKKVIGMLTLKDILRIEPTLFRDVSQIERIKEESEKLERIRHGGKRMLRQGMCEECGNFDILFKIDGRLLCETCKDRM